MTRGPLCELVPIENASMPDRTVIEWDKDDIDDLGILKVDVLALGMLTCIAKAMKLIDTGKVSRKCKRRWANRQEIIVRQGVPPRLRCGEQSPADPLHTIPAGRPRRL